jgi:cytochrome c553
MFAFFYAKRFFEKRGDASRNKQGFTGKCAECHAAGGVGKTVTEWTSLADSVELVQRLWNHAPKIPEQAEKRKQAWPELSETDMENLTAFLNRE